MCVSHTTTWRLIRSWAAEAAAEEDWVMVPDHTKVRVTSCSLLRAPSCRFPFQSLHHFHHCHAMACDHSGALLDEAAAPDQVMSKVQATQAAAHHAS
jgi:hypothetical protein